MSRQRTTGTQVELSVRRLLHARGYRYRVNLGQLVAGRRYRGDIVWTRQKLVVFLDGCFWHGCPIHGTTPKSNTLWWRKKLDENARRDAQATSLLVDAGWRVLRFWEHEAPEDIVSRIETELECIRLHRDRSQGSSSRQSAERSDADVVHGGKRLGQSRC